MLTAGGRNAQMREWYMEFKELKKQLRAAKAARATRLLLEETMEAAAQGTVENETAPKRVRRITFKDPIDDG